ncbi:uncharacterized protein LOC121374199 [Gigantopelta aegis]|uniref:uncharacterized protein LOC121374199 n=1 Tax=Gigantopelta aegis TaxID=1735272 RepID=UPI001B88E6D0|nr:uncharacterized protein LOC121374199 [Gigantopelta aegis]
MSFKGRTPYKRGNMLIYINDLNDEITSSDFFDVFKRNSVRQVKLMLEAGYDVNARNIKMETPLMACVKHCHDPVCRAGLVKLLFDAGADINLRNGRGQSVLMYSCVLNQLDTVITMLQKENLDVNQCDDDGNTALMYACNLGFPEIVATFLEAHRLQQHTLDLKKQNYDGFTALDHAADSRHFNIVRLFCQFMKVPEAYLRSDANAVGDTINQRSVTSSVINTPQINDRILRYIKDVRDPPMDKQNTSLEKRDELSLPAQVSGSVCQPKNASDFSLSHLGDQPDGIPDRVTGITNAYENSQEYSDKKIHQKASAWLKREKNGQMPMSKSVVSDENRWNRTHLKESSSCLESKPDYNGKDSRKGKSTKQRDTFQSNNKFAGWLRTYSSNNNSQNCKSPPIITFTNQNEDQKNSSMNCNCLSRPSSTDLKLGLGSSNSAIHLDEIKLPTYQDPVSRPPTPYPAMLCSPYSERKGIAFLLQGTSMEHWNGDRADHINDDVKTSYRLPKATTSNTNQISVHGKPLPKISNKNNAR